MSNISALAQSRGERREGEVVQSWVWAGTRRARMSQSPILTVTTASVNQSGERIGAISCGRAVLINGADWSTIWTYSVANAAIYVWKSFCKSLWFDQIKNRVCKQVLGAPKTWNGAAPFQSCFFPSPSHFNFLCKLCMRRFYEDGRTSDLT